MSKTAKTKTRKNPGTKAKFKADQVIGLLNRPIGTTIAEMMKATDWQAHSVRGFMAGSLKKKGHELYSEVDAAGIRRYHIKAKVES